MLEFYTSPEFRTYRKHLIKTVVDYMRPRIQASDPNDFWKLQGALDVARKIIDLPASDLKHDDLKRHAKEDVESVFASIIRGNLEG